jgi:ABC-type branched-subunit amino acid transport system ATPase component
MAMETLLDIRDVHKSFDSLRALKGCSFEVGRGEILGVIGPNGSGKTTLFNIVAGFLRPDAGSLLFRGENIAGLPPYRIARRGIGRTFQITRIFPKMTLVENLLVAARIDDPRARADEYLELIGMAHLRDEYASDLSFGQQKLLALMQVLMLDPALILLDEPAAGINPTLLKRLLELVHRLNEAGKTFMIIEHNMDVVMQHCGRIVVLSLGEKIAEGAPAEVRADERVTAAYFGK